MSLPPAEAQKTIAQAEQARQAHERSSPGILPVIFWMIIIIVMISAFSRGVRGRRYYRGGSGISPWIVLWGLSELSRGSRGGGGWGGGGGWVGGGGGGFSGGGGSFGGGGASGSW
jgi:uncharacterized protein